MVSYIPKKGDFIALRFDPQSGHEQMGTRPALVVSNTIFNEQTGFAIVCPLTYQTAKSFSCASHGKRINRLYHGGST